MSQLVDRILASVDQPKGAGQAAYANGNVVRVAAEVKVDVADELGDSATSLQKSLVLLEAIKASLSNDLMRR